MSRGGCSRAPRASRASRGAAASRPWWKRWWVALLVVPAVALGAVGLLVFFYVFSSVPLPDDIAAIDAPEFRAEAPFGVGQPEHARRAARGLRVDAQVGRRLVVQGRHEHALVRRHAV